MKKNLLLVLVLSSFATIGQTNLAGLTTVNLSSGNYVNPCGNDITIYDDGGPTGNYTASQSAVVTIASTGLARIGIEAGGTLGFDTFKDGEHDYVLLSDLDTLWRNDDPISSPLPIQNTYNVATQVQLDFESYNLSSSKPAGFVVEVKYQGDCNGNRWDGTAWNNGARTPYTAQTAAQNIEIAGNYTVNPKDVLRCNNLTVASGATLTISSNLTGWGQLYATGTITNNGTIIFEQYLSKLGIFGIASPMNNGFSTTNGNSNDLTGYDAGTGSYSSSISTTAVGHGYFINVGGLNAFLSSASTFTITGTPNTSHTHSLGYSTSVATGGSGAGWNLIGNPYTSALDWSSVTLSNVNNAFYIWDDANTAYVYYAPGASPAPSGTYIQGSSLTYPYVQPGQAFWVQATSSGATVSSQMNTDCDVSGRGEFYKRAPDNLIFMVKHATDSTKGDATWLVANDQATLNFDGEFDAWKLTNAGDNLNLYTQVVDERLAINALDLSSTSIDLGFDGTIGENYTMEVSKITDGTNYDVYLEDRVENIMVALDQPYSFTNSSVRGDSTRFKVYVNKNTMGSEEVVNQQFTVATATSGLNLSGYAAQFNTYRIIALNGQMLSNGSLAEGTTFVDLDRVANTTVLVCLIGEGGSFTSKKVVVTN